MDEEITTNRVVRKIQQLPQHNTIKLNETIYLLWKQRVMLILEGYGVQEYIQDSATISQFIVNEESQLIENPEFFLHNQQDKLLASWLLPTVSDDLLVYLTIASTSFKVWSTIEKRYSTRSKGSLVIDQEQVSIILAGLPIEYKSIEAVALAALVSLELLAELLTNCETRQLHFIASIPLQVNMVQKKSGLENQ
ncbi:hypothetical protein PVK06_023619 [Gossypium arboreum]|uniref:Uncharacterized protein n=1 Tax=Gossypium arboreum TaxID=29729 RepID=A0ABR0PBK3_GOSAR|nr:hypothetical protein PVK06_023619 [Gossypium arboreum]